MVLQKDQFPITIQAFELTGGKELFIAEQIVNTQPDADAFSAKYAGKIIKAKAVAPAIRTTGGTPHTITTNTYRRKWSTGTVVLVILIFLVILLAISYYIFYLLIPMK